MNSFDKKDSLISNLLKLFVPSNLYIFKQIGVTWLTLTAKSKANVLSVYLCKLLLEYGILNNDE